MDNSKVVKKSNFVERYAGAMGRRKFIKTAAAATASFTIIKPALVRGTEANSRVEVGCVGLGGRGNMIANMFASHGGYKITALCDYFPNVVDAVGKRLSVPKENLFSGLGGYKGLIDSGVDGVVLKTPPYCFPDHATAAIKAGCHVYVAKPIAVDVPGCLQMLKMGRLATERKQVFLVDFQMRINPYLIECIRLLREGIIGDLHLIRSYYDDEGYRDPPKTKTVESRLRNLIWANDIDLGGGKFVNSGVHAIDAALWIAGQTPVSASGLAIVARREPHGDTKDIYSVTYRFKGDRLLLNHTGEHFRNLQSRIAHCDAYGQFGYIEARYSGKNWIRSEKKGFDGGYKGGEKPDIYRWGARENIDTFHKSIVGGKCDNPTVEPSVNATLACILGREAGKKNGLVTWDELLRENRKIEPDLTGLKQ